MRKLICLLALAVVVAVGAGCAKMPQSAYSPQSLYRTQGIMSFGTFTYLAPTGKQNQIDTSGGWMVFHDEMSVAEYVKHANILEAENCGIKVSKEAQTIVNAAIKRLEIKDFGFSADVYYSVVYTVFENGKKLVFPYDLKRVGLDKHLQLHIEKINTMISESFEKLLKDLKFDS